MLVRKLIISKNFGETIFVRALNYHVHAIGRLYGRRSLSKRSHVRLKFIKLYVHCFHSCISRFLGFCSLKSKSLKIIAAYRLLMLFGPHAVQVVGVKWVRQHIRHPRGWQVRSGRGRVVRRRLLKENNWEEHLKYMYGNEKRSEMIVWNRQEHFLTEWRPSKKGWFLSEGSLKWILRGRRSGAGKLMGSKPAIPEYAAEAKEEDGTKDEASEGNLPIATR